MMMNEQNKTRVVYSTRSGLLPDISEPSFDATTTGVRDFLINGINTVTRSRQIPEFTANEISLYSIEAGKNFTPFVLKLPLRAMEGKAERANSNVPSVFENKGEEADRSVVLLPEIYKYLNSFAYKKEDIAAFNSDNVRRQFRMSRERVANLRSLRIPKIKKFGKEKAIILLIDPLRIFHFMLEYTDRGVNEFFDVSIIEINKIRQGECKYKIKKIDKKKKKRNDIGIFEELNRAFRGK
jgi:hypothetical protein